MRLLHFLLMCGLTFATDSVWLRSDGVSVEIRSDGPGLRLSELVSGSQDRNLISGSALPLYVLFSDLEDRQLTNAFGAQFAQIQKNSERWATIVTTHPDLGLEVTIEVRLTSDPGVSFSIAVARTDADTPVAAIACPVAGLATHHGSNVLLGVADGILVRDPLSRLHDGEIRSYAYPGFASTQMMACYDDIGGVMTYAPDHAGYRKQLTFRRVGQDVVLTHDYLCLHDTTNRIVVPYAIRWAVFDGDWMDAADVYRAWANRQFWCHERLETRDIYSGFKSPHLFFVYNMLAQPEPFDYLAPLSHTWAEALGIPVTNIIVGWEKDGIWIGPDYLPPAGGEVAFSEMVHALPADHRAMVFLSGLRCIVEREGHYQAPQSLISSLLPMAIVGGDGQPQVFGAPDESVGSYLELCPAIDASWDYVLDATAGLKSLGVDVIQMDQLVGGGSPLCFAENHGHLPVSGTTVFDSVSKQLQTMRAIARGDQADGAVTLEEPHELLMQIVDGFHVRDYMFGHWPRYNQGDDPVALFPYLYHEFGLGYGGDSAPLVQSDEDLPMAIYAQAINLLAGRHPGAAYWGEPASVDLVHPRQIQFMADVAELMQGPARPYLLFGKMLPVRVESPDMIIRYDRGTHEASLTTPAIQGAAFSLADGSAVGVVVNLSDQTQNLNLVFPEEYRAASGHQIWPQFGPARAHGQSLSLSACGIVAWTMPTPVMTYRTYLAHFNAMGAHWQTTLMLTNPNNCRTTVRVQCLDGSGAQPQYLEWTLPPRASLQQDLQNLLPDTFPKNGFLVFESFQPISAVATYRFIPTNGTTSLPLVDHGGKKLTFPSIQNNDAWQTGLALSNISDDDATIRWQALDPAGSLVIDLTTALPARSKIVVMTADILGEDLPEQTQLRIDANRELIALALMFSNGNNQIVALPPSVHSSLK